jgi:hypothetical protein
VPTCPSTQAAVAVQHPLSIGALGARMPQSGGAGVATAKRSVPMAQSV